MNAQTITTATEPVHDQTCRRFIISRAKVILVVAEMQMGTGIMRSITKRSTTDIEESRKQYHLDLRPSLIQLDEMYNYTTIQNVLSLI